MVIIVRDAPDSNIPRACEIETAAYANYPASEVLFPGPFPTDSRDERPNGLIKTRNEDPTVRYIEAVEEETGQVLAFSKWHIYDTPEKANAGMKARSGFGPGTNPAACEAFFGGLFEKRMNIIGGKRHIYLHMLHTDPKYQGRGAGSAIMKWGLERADEIGLPIYLESSPVGHGFYQKHGFKDVDLFSFDLGKFGGENRLHNTPHMIRQPGKILV